MIFQNPNCSQNFLFLFSETTSLFLKTLKLSVEIEWPRFGWFRLQKKGNQNQTSDWEQFALFSMSNYKESTRDPKDSEVSLRMWSIVALKKASFDMRHKSIYYLHVNITDEHFWILKSKYVYVSNTVFFFFVSWATFSWGTCQSCLKNRPSEVTTLNIILYITRRSCLASYT